MGLPPPPPLKQQQPPLYVHRLHEVMNLSFLELGEHDTITRFGVVWHLGVKLKMRVGIRLVSLVDEAILLCLSDLIRSN